MIVIYIQRYTAD